MSPGSGPQPFRQETQSCQDPGIHLIRKTNIGYTLKGAMHKIKAHSLSLKGDYTFPMPVSGIEPETMN